MQKYWELGLTGVLLLTHTAARGQVARKLEFEVASVRPSAPQSAAQLMPFNGYLSGGPGTSDPSRMTFSGVPLSSILTIAFDIPANRLKAPEWTGNVLTPLEKYPTVNRVDLTAARYDIIATVPPGTTRAQAHEMLRNLLVDRFKLSYHIVKKDFDGYAATVPKGGVKLRPSEAAGEPEAAPLPPKFPLGPDGFAELPAGHPAIVGIVVDGSRKVRWSFRTIPIATLLEMLRQFYSSTVRFGTAENLAGDIFDDTGMTGTYDFEFEYPLGARGFARALDYASGSKNFAEVFPDLSWRNIIRFQTASDIKPDLAALAKEALEALEAQPESDPALIAAIEKQIGIRLVRRKVPLDVVTVDHIEKIPTEN